MNEAQAEHIRLQKLHAEGGTCPHCCGGELHGTCKKCEEKK
jgi:hypothetical protein